MISHVEVGVGACRGSHVLGQGARFDVHLPRVVDAATVRTIRVGDSTVGDGECAEVVGDAAAGAVEVRAAGNAFLDMRHRIERQIEQRTMMLSGVSNDLRTPLTRMRLGLSMLDEDDAEGMAAALVELSDPARRLPLQHGALATAADYDERLCAERCPTGAWDMQKSTVLIPYASDEAADDEAREAPAA